jgi:transposase InsO family protein
MGPDMPSNTMNDPLPTSIPRLEPTGSNWAIFSMRFQEAMEANRKWGHFDDSTPRPDPADTSKPTDEEKKAMSDWDQEEVVARYLLSQRLPDSTAVRLKAITSVKERWDKVKAEFSIKSQYAETDLLTAFNEMRCPRGGDVRAFLGSMRVKREELAAVGVTMGEKEYRSAIIKSIPDEMSKFASGLLTAARVLSSKSIDPDILIDHISEEADRLAARRRRDTGTSGKGKQPQSHGQDEALAATQGDGGKRRKKGKCHNCGKQGHWARECRSPKKDQQSNNNQSQSSGQSSQQSQPPTYQNATKPENKPVGSANVVADPDDEPDGCWSAVFIGDVPNPVEATVDSHWTHEEAGASAALSGGLAAAAITQIEEVKQARVELYDSGATRHISPYRNDFTTYRALDPPMYLKAANGQQFPAVGTGDMVISAPNGDQESDLTLEQVLHAPSVGYTLVSLGTLDSLGYHIAIGGGHLEISSRDGNRIARIARTPRGLYRVSHEGESGYAVEVVSVMELHRRMGHIAPASARKLITNGLVTGIALDPNSREEHCEACIYARATREPVPKLRVSKQASQFGDEIHTDVSGPAEVNTRAGRRYFVTYTDDATRYTTTFLLTAKSEAFSTYQRFEAWACTQNHCRAIKVLRSDRGGEYLSKEFDQHLATAGTARRLTVHDTPQLNGIAERLNRTLGEKVRALLHTATLPQNMWGEAVRHATWLKNRTSTRALGGMTPWQALYGTPPDLSRLKRFGETVWVHDPTGSKLQPRARVGQWIGFDVESRGHRVYWPKNQTVSVERSVYFAAADRLEGENIDVPTSKALQSEPLVPSPTPSSADPPEASPPSPASSLSSLSSSSSSRAVSDVLQLDEPEPQPEPELRRSSRNRTASRWVRDLQEGVGVSSTRRSDPKVPRGVTVPGGFELGEEEAEFVDVLAEVWSVEAGLPTLRENWLGFEVALVAETSNAEALEPRNLAEAKRRPDWPLWEHAIREELDTLRTAGTWTLESAPPGANIIGSKWVFKAKKDASGKVVRYKARLVAQGFSQVEGVDYFDTYAPVARLPSSRAVIAMANRLGLELHQVDIKGAYLNGELTADEVLYMRHPPGYREDTSGRVLRLRKSLYGLKQAGRRWYQKFTEILGSLGFSQCKVDQAVFYKHSKSPHVIIIIAVHVDDCTIAANSTTAVDALKAGLRKHVEITDLGELHWMLGIEVRRDRAGGTIHLSQRSYIDSILRRFSFDDVKPVSTPFDTQVRLTLEQAPADTAEFAVMRDVPYREAVGALNWAALATRPDIAFAVSTVARFSANPGMAHWNAVKRIFRYLAGTRDLWLTYGEARRTLVGYADADGSMTEDRRAITGYAFLIDGGAVSWSSKKQEIVSLSTTESEYVAATHGMKEALWLRNLLAEVFEPTSDATTLFSDNQSAIALTRDHQFHARTKHIDVRYHFIRWVVENGALRLVYCPTADMVADALTKALPSPKVKHFAECLGLRAV